jgi:hypothetical protein
MATPTKDYHFYKATLTNDRPFYKATLTKDQPSYKATPTQRPHLLSGLISDAQIL